MTTDETHGSIARGLVASLLRSPDYSPGDVVRTLRGVSATQEALLSELAVMDLVQSLPTIGVPVVMVQGRPSPFRNAVGREQRKRERTTSTSPVWLPNETWPDPLPRPCTRLPAVTANGIAIEVTRISCTPGTVMAGAPSGHDGSRIAGR